MPRAQRRTVAGYPEVDEVPVGEVRPGEHGRHAAVDRIEAMRIAEEVVGRLRRAPDAGQLGQLLRPDAQLPDRLRDRRGDRVVATARAQRRHRAFVVAAREPELVLRQIRVADFRFVDERHGK